MPVEKFGYIFIQKLKVVWHNEYKKDKSLLLGDPPFSSYRYAFSLICICHLRDYHVFIFFCFLRFSKALSLTLFLVFLDNDKSTFDVIQYHLNNKRLLLVTSSYLIYICTYIFECNKTIYKSAIVHYTIDQVTGSIVYFLSFKNIIHNVFFLSQCILHNNKKQ
jgi:hypothetical protein